MNKPYKHQVEELELLFGEGTKSLGRTRIKEICRIGDSSISMWKVNGVPASHRGRLYTVAQRYQLDPPDWLIRFDVPKSLSAFDNRVLA